MSVYTQTVVEVSLTGAQTTTLIMITADSSKRLKITEIGISFKGVTASAVPVPVELYRASTAGTSSSGGYVRSDPDEPVALSSPTITFTAEPTLSELVRSWNVTPYAGLFIWSPLKELWVPKSGRIALRARPAANVDVSAHIEIEE